MNSAYATTYDTTFNNLSFDLKNGRLWDTYTLTGSYTVTTSDLNNVNPIYENINLSATLNGNNATVNLVNGAFSFNGGTALAFNYSQSTDPVSGVITGTFAYISNAYYPLSTQRNISGTVTSTPRATAVPEPEAYAMMLAGLGLMGFAARRKQQAA